MLLWFLLPLCSVVFRDEKVLRMYNDGFGAEKRRLREGEREVSGIELLNGISESFAVVKAILV